MENGHWYIFWLRLGLAGLFGGFVFRAVCFLFFDLWIVDWLTTGLLFRGYGMYEVASGVRRYVTQLCLCRYQL